MNKQDQYPKSPTSVSIFYPYYRDWGTMGSLVLMTVSLAERLDLDYDLQIVNDGSFEPQDAVVLGEISKFLPSIKIISHEKNLGYGRALRSGFAAAGKEWVFYTDGDAQYDVMELESLLAHIGPEVDVVQGYKLARSDQWHRIIIGRIYHHVVKFMFGLKIRDTDCDFRLIRRAVFDRVELKSDSGMICVEMMFRFHQAGLRFVEVPVHHYPRAHGKSQFFNFRRLFVTLVNLGRYWLEERALPRFRK